MRAQPHTDLPLSMATPPAPAQDGVEITRDLYDTLVLMLTTMNAGIDLVKLEKGWGAQGGAG